MKIIIKDKKACVWERTGARKKTAHVRQSFHTGDTDPLLSAHGNEASKGPTNSKCSSKQLEIIAVRSFETTH
jgi:hypothetical protein